MVELQFRWIVLIFRIILAKNLKEMWIYKNLVYFQQKFWDRNEINITPLLSLFGLYHIICSFSNTFYYLSTYNSQILGFLKLFVCWIQFKSLNYWIFLLTFVILQWTSHGKRRRYRILSVITQNNRKWTIKCPKKYFKNQQ